MLVAKCCKVRVVAQSRRAADVTQDVRFVVAHPAWWLVLF